jgi:hypothetical protein
MNLNALRLETKLQQDGTLTLDHLPFQAGQAVEVIVVPLVKLAGTDNPYPLRGLPIHYERPTDPVAEEDWEALK